MHKLLLNFTWWVNRKDASGNNVFEGGFLGLDNVGPFDRSAALPVAGVLEQSDGTGWMAMYALNLLDMALTLAVHDRAYEDIATKFFEHFAYIAEAAYEQGLWDDEDGFFYDVLRLPDGHQVPLKVRSVVGLLPLAATTSSVLGHAEPAARAVAARLRWFLHEQAGVRRRGRRPPAVRRRPAAAPAVDGRAGPAGADPGADARRGGVPVPVRAAHAVPAAPGQAVHRARSAGSDFTVGYEPAESTSGLFGGNSNWRGPIWMPVNYLLIEALRRVRARSSATTCWSSTRPARGSKRDARPRSPTTCPAG